MAKEHIPALICATCLLVYWCSVIVLGMRLRRKIGKGPNSIPKDPVSLIMRLIWGPAILLQVTHAFRLGLDIHRFEIWRGLIVLPFGEPRATPAWWFWSPEVPGWWVNAAFAAAGMVVVCLSLTFICWHKMGTSWRIGIDDSEKLEFISTGPYKIVRHPIYALRILLGLCAIVAIPTVFMAVVTLTDITLLNIEARREERYMERTHGKAYGDYRRRVGRFIPWIVVP